MLIQLNLSLFKFFLKFQILLVYVFGDLRFNLIQFHLEGLPLYILNLLVVFYLFGFQFNFVDLVLHYLLIVMLGLW